MLSLPVLMVVSAAVSVNVRQLERARPGLGQGQGTTDQSGEGIGGGVIDSERGGDAAVGHGAGADASVGQASDRLGLAAQVECSGAGYRQRGAGWQSVGDTVTERAGADRCVRRCKY